MRILLVNVDSKFNLAIRRMYNYFKNEHKVDMIDLGLDGYPSKKFKSVNAFGYDKVYVSNIFDVNQDKFEITMNDNVIYGGVGTKNKDDYNRRLPKEIEDTEPFYKDEEKISYGFITRGCIRKCWFCKVHTHEGKLYKYNDVDDIVKHKKVKFMDNNILAYEKHKEVLKELVYKKIKCQFNQGLDIRIIDDENSKLLSELKYIGEYYFAFDNVEDEIIIKEKLELFKKYVSKDWKVKFFIYHNKELKIKDLIYRVDWCRKNKCLPYVMRDINCWESEEKNFLIDYTAYCNQPSIFKKMKFEEFLYKRHTKEERIKESLKVYEVNNV